MKKYLFLLLPAFILFSCTSPNKNVISGDIKGLEKGDKVFLTIGAMSEVPVVIDSVIVDSDGSFYMETPLADIYTSLFMIKKGQELDLNRARARFFMEGFSTINIDGDIDDLYSAKPTGGLYAMAQMEQRNAVADSANILGNAYNEKYDIYFRLKDNSNSNQDALKKAKEEYYKSLDVLFDNQEKGRLLDSCFRENNPNVAYSASILRSDYGAMKRGIGHYDSLYNKLTPRVKATLEGKSLGNYIATLKATSVGAIAPNFKAKDISGNDISLSDFKGKYVFLEFWATSCPPCIRLMPHVVDMYEKVKGDNFEVISVASREGSERYLLKVIDELGMRWNNINDTKGEVGKMYGVTAYPTSLFIDPTGKIIEVGHPYDVIPKVESTMLGK